MKISIITATFNSARTIKDCVKSVDDQSFENIEHIIIDGASTDNTIEVINSIKNRVKLIISEPDRGIYDAMNKGIDHSTGDIIGFLNSDDYFTGNEVLSEIMGCFENNGVDCIFGDINYVSSRLPEKIIRSWKSGQYISGSFRKGWHPAHPAFYVKTTVYKKFGNFNLHFKLAADFELMLRFLEKEQISNIYIENSIVNMRLGGATNNSIRNILKQNYECYQSFKTNNLPVSFLYPFFRLIPKLKQYI
jgi:glycosyltransferase involved in cell wall biosynthesis